MNGSRDHRTIDTPNAVRAAVGKRRCLIAYLILMLTMAPAGAGGQAPPQTKPDLIIGAFDGQPWEALGRLVDAALLPDGGVVALDGFANRIYVYGATGEHAHSIAGGGAGPGEFRVPVSIQIDGDLIHVLDRANARISTFDLKSGELLRDLRLSVDAYDFCAVDDGFLLLGVAGGAILHLIDRQGAPQESIASPLLREPLYRDHSTRGFIVCDRANQRFTHVASILPTVRQFDRGGRILWSTALPQFVPMSMTPGPYGGVALGAPADGSRDGGDVNVALVQLPEDRILVQYGAEFYGMQGPEDIWPVTSVVLNARTGAVERVVTGLPRILSAGDGHVLGYEPNPYPKLHRYLIRALPVIGGGGSR